jgi:hypothetical protein
LLVGLRKPFAYLRGDLWEEMGIRKKQLHWQQRSLTQRASRAGCRIKPLGTASPATNASVSRPCFACLLRATKPIEISGRGRARSGGRIGTLHLRALHAAPPPPHRAQSLPLARSTRAPPLSGCSLSFTGLGVFPPLLSLRAAQGLGEDLAAFGLQVRSEDVQDTSRKRTSARCCARRQFAAEMRALFSVCCPGCLRCCVRGGVLEGPECQNEHNSPADGHQVHREYFPHERPVESGAWWALRRLILIDS